MICGIVENINLKHFMKNKIRRILMLDLDGVVNYTDYLIKNGRREDSFAVADPEKIKLLNQLKDFGVEVVISSSWGTTADKILKDTGLELPIIGYTSHFHNDEKYQYVCRGNEIERWFLQEFGQSTKWGPSQFDDFKYVILDDDDDMLYGQRNNFIHVDREIGLTQEDINTVRKILE